MLHCVTRAYMQVHLGKLFMYIEWAKELWSPTGNTLAGPLPGLATHPPHPPLLLSMLYMLHLPYYYM